MSGHLPSTMASELAGCRSTRSTFRPLGAEPVIREPALRDELLAIVERELAAADAFLRCDADPAFHRGWIQHLAGSPTHDHRAGSLGQPAAGGRCPARGQPVPRGAPGSDHRRARMASGLRSVGAEGDRGVPGGWLAQHADRVPNDARGRRGCRRSAEAVGERRCGSPAPRGTHRPGGGGRPARPRSTARSRWSPPMASPSLGIAGRRSGRPRRAAGGSSASRPSARRGGASRRRSSRGQVRTRAGSESAGEPVAEGAGRRPCVGRGGAGEPAAGPFTGYGRPARGDRRLVRLRALARERRVLIDEVEGADHRWAGCAVARMAASWRSPDRAGTLSVHRPARGGRGRGPSS